MNEDYDRIVFRNGTLLLGEIIDLSDRSLHVKTSQGTRIIPCFNVRSYTLGSKIYFPEENEPTEKKLVNGRQQDEFIHELNKLTGKS